jgi:hypothetical protein
MPIIDIHTHAFPDEIAQRAIAKLQANSEWKAVSEGAVSALVKSMDAAGIEISVLCTIATKPDQVEGILKWCRQIRNPRVEPLPSVHPRTPKAGDWVRRFAEEGFRGIKLHPMYQDFAADDPCMNEVYAAAAETGLFVESHCGLDIAYPPDDDRATPIRFRRVIERFPRLTLICTHMGGWRMWDQVQRELLGTGVYLETSFSLFELGPKRAAEMIRRHGIEKVLFGTDWPWADQAKEVALLAGLGLDQPQTAAILEGNARRLLHGK